MAVKSNDELLFTAPVLITDKPDCDYHRGEKPFTEDEIRFFKESFEDYQIIDKEHQVFKDLDNAKTIGEPVDSFILNENTTYTLVDGTSETYPKGTWMLTTNITDPIAQEEIVAGKLNGYSLSVHREDIGKFIKEYMATKASAGRLIHDVENPNAISVSLVGKPCQSGSKPCELGSDVMSDDKKTLDKIRELLVGDKPEYATKSDFDALAKELREENSAAMKSLSEEISEKVSGIVAESLKELGATKAKKLTPEEEEEEEETEPQNEEEEEEEDDKKKKNKKTKKDGSKQGSVHGAVKSDYDAELDTYAVLGRNPDGTRKRQ